MISIRPYRAETDLDACLGIWRRASRAGHPFLTAGHLAADEVLVRDVYMPAADIRVAAEDDAVIGFIALLDTFIGGLFVAPERHGKGVGRALVEHAAALRGPLDVDVYAANDAALRFYVRLGFHETGRRETDDQGRPFAIISMRRQCRPGAMAQPG